MPLHHNFVPGKQSNPYDIWLRCSVQPLESNQVQTLLPPLRQHTTATMCTPAAIRSAQVCVYLFHYQQVEVG